MIKDVCYIIISYNGDKHLKRLIRVLKNYNLIIVDNASNNGMISEITSLFPLVTVLKNKGNIGYGPAANVGIRYGYKKGYNWFVILNQDIMISEKFITDFTKQLSNTIPGIAGPFKGVLDTKRYTSILEKNEDSLIDYISGSIVAIHKKVIEKIGYFYEPYFMYYEDVDYCVRARKFFPIHLINLRGVKHFENTSIGANSFLHQYYLSRNHLLFVQKLAPLRVRTYEILRLPKTIIEHLYKKELGALHGIKDYMLQKFGKYQI